MLGKNLQTVFDLGQYYPQIETGVKSEVADFFNAMGIELTDLIIARVIHHRKRLPRRSTKRSSMGAMGNLDAYMKFKTAQSIEKAAENEGGGMAGLGAGLGAGMGIAGMMNQSFQNMNQGTNQQGGNQQGGQQQQQQQETKMSADEIMSADREAGQAEGRRIADAGGI